jgi:hypothetical protein
MPVFSSTDLRAAVNSFLLMRLAFSKGNSFIFFIAPPFTPVGSPSADNATNLLLFLHGKRCDQHSIIRFTVSGEIVEGRLPPRVLGLVQEWREYHRAELAEDWNLAREREALKRIKPLE